MTVLRALPSARLVGRGVAGTPVRRVSWPVGPPGPPCWKLPEPGGLGLSVGSWTWGRTVSEYWVVAVLVGVAACACVGGSSGGAYARPAVGRSGVPWRGRGSGWACAAAAWLAASS